MNEVKEEVENLYKDFRLSEALKIIYSLIWDDFCSWYLEWVKPGFEQPVDKNVYDKTVEFFGELMQLLHPFMPFVTEEIYHQLKERTEGDDLVIKQYEPIAKADKKILEGGILLKEVITAIRDARNKNKIKFKDKITLHILSANSSDYKMIESILKKQVNADKINYVSEPVSNALTVIVQRDKFFIETENSVNTSSQKEELLKDLEYLKGFVLSVEKKLNNKKFVQNAKPEVVETEKKKKADAEDKIKAIEEALGLF